MRCICCNKALNDYEATARHVETNEFLDTCLKCLKEIGIGHVGRSDLYPYEEVEDHVEEWEEDE